MPEYSLFYEHVVKPETTERGTGEHGMPEREIRNLRIFRGRKHHQMKLQRIQKVQIWALGSLSQQVTS